MTCRRGVVLGLAAGGLVQLAGPAFAALPAALWPPLGSGARVLGQAQALAARQDFAGALRVLEEWLARSPRAPIFEHAFLRGFAADCALRAARPEAARAHARRAAALLGGGTCTEASSLQLGRLRLEIGKIHDALGEPAHVATQLGAALIDLAQDAPEEAAVAAKLLGPAQSELQRFAEAAATLRRGIELAREARVVQGELPVLLWTNLASALVEGSPLAAIDAAEEAVRQAEAAADGEPALLRLASYAKAQVLLHKPALREAEDLLLGLTRGAEHDGLRGHALYLLANTHYDRGHIAEAAAVGFAALEAYQVSLPPAHPVNGRVLQLLGTAHMELGDLAAATAFLVRAADVFRTAFGADAPQVHAVQIERAALEIRKALAERAASDMRFARAERSAAERRAALQPAVTDPAQEGLDRAQAWAREALRVFEAQDPPQERLQSFAHSVLALVEESRLERRADDAAARYDTAQRLLRRSRGPLSPDLGYSLLRRARLLTSEGIQLDTAERLLGLAEDLYDAHGAAATVRMAEVMTAQAELHLARDRHDLALRRTREALATLQARLDRAAPAAPGDGTERRGAREPLAAQAWLLLTLAPEDPEAREQAFAACQEALATAAGDAMRRTALRLAHGTGPLARVLEAREAAAEDLRQIDALLSRALGRLDQAVEPAALRRLQARRAAAASALVEAEARLQAEHRDTAEFLAQRPVTLAQAGATLEPDEAMLMLIAGEKGGILWTLDHEGATPRLVESLARPELGTAVAALRRELTLALDRFRAGERLGEMESSRARQLFTRIFGEAEASGRLHRTRTKHVLLVPDGALQRLPPHLLRDTRNAWLASRYAVTTLPSVAARHLARRTDRVSPGAEAPFLGIGNVVTRLAGAGAACAGPFTTLRQELDCLAELEETAPELRELARLAEAPAGSVLLGGAATKPAFIEKGPGRHRILAFATHALMGGVSAWLPEPAIVLSALPGGDGQEALLTASEIATLSLSAELVVLSACNTAAPVAEAQAEGLSGLARAFLHAGARCVVASHWPVASDAAAALTVAFMTALRTTPRPRPAEALQAAMLKVQQQDGRRFAHPYYWAPFVVIGT